MRQPLTRLTQSLALAGTMVLSVMALILLAPALLGNTAQGQVDHDADQLDSTTLLVATSRDRLAVCIEPVDVSLVDTEAVTASIYEALKQVSNHRYWEPAGLAREAPAVSISCDADPHLTQPGVEIAGQKVVGARAPVVERASPFRVFMFVLPDAEIERLGGRDAPIATEEYLCSGDVCGGATSGIYIGQRDLDDQSRLVGLLEKAIGLEPVVPIENVGPDGIEDRE